MRIVFAFLISVFAGLAFGREVFRCDEPRGVSMWSTKEHKPTADGFTGVNPVVIIDGDEMTVVWGDAQSAGGTEKAWKAVVFHRSPEVVSAVASVVGPNGSAAMLFTVDVMRRLLYYSSHRENKSLASTASSFVSRCK